jgi:hypothetical protein
MTEHELWNALILVRIGMYVAERNPEGLKTMGFIGQPVPSLK